MKRFLTLTSVGAVMAASSALAASFTILNPGQAVGTFPTLTPGSGQTAPVETFTGNVLTFSTFSLVGGSQGTTRGISNQRFNDQVDQGAGNVQTTQFSLLSPTNSIYGWAAVFDLTPGGNGADLRITVRFVDNSTAVVAGVGCNTTLNPGCTTTALNQYGGTYGWGFTSDTAIAAVIISADNNTAVYETYNLDNMQMIVGPTVEGPGPGPGPGPSVPEPSSFGLMGLAMVGLGLIRKVRK